MKRFLMALTLTCALALSTNAGDISTSGSPTPPPPAPVQTDSTTPGDIYSVQGHISTDGVAEQLANNWFTVLTAILSF